MGCVPVGVGPLLSFPSPLPLTSPRTEGIRSRPDRVGTGVDGSSESRYLRRSLRESGGSRVLFPPCPPWRVVGGFSECVPVPPLSRLPVRRTTKIVGEVEVEDGERRGSRESLVSYGLVQGRREDSNSEITLSPETLVPGSPLWTTDPPTGHPSLTRSVCHHPPGTQDTASDDGEEVITSTTSGVLRTPSPHVTLTSFVVLSLLPQDLVFPFLD